MHVIFFATFYLIIIQKLLSCLNTILMKLCHSKIPHHRNMVMRELAPQFHIPWSIPMEAEDIPIVPTTSGTMCVPFSTFIHYTLLLIGKSSLLKTLLGSKISKKWLTNFLKEQQMFKG